MNEETMIILNALRREASNQGAHGNEWSSFASHMLYRIAQTIEDELDELDFNRLNGKLDTRTIAKN